MRQRPHDGFRWSSDVPFDVTVLGKGVYTAQQAARLIRASRQDVYRWTRQTSGNLPLWQNYYNGTHNTSDLSFEDLVELRVVRALRLAGISLQAIRFAISFASKRLMVDRPLSRLDFKTDGKEILVAAIEQDGEHVSLSKRRPGQKVFTDIVRQSLRDLEYEDGQAARWRPAGYQAIVIDPLRQFGQPIVDDFGVSTEVLSADFCASGSFSYVARLYEVPEKSVRDAVRFEASLEEANGQSSI